MVSTQNTFHDIQHGPQGLATLSLDCRKEMVTVGFEIALYLNTRRGIPSGYFTK